MELSGIKSQIVYTISCIECRRRKIKCDKLSPACSNCLFKKNDCEFPQNAKRKIINLDILNGDGDGNNNVNGNKDEIIKNLLQRCATLEDYLKLTKLEQDFKISEKIESKNFIEMIEKIDRKLHDIAINSNNLDLNLLSQYSSLSSNYSNNVNNNFPSILNEKTHDEVLLNNIISTVFKNFKAICFFLNEKDVDQFFINFKKETLKPIHFKDSLIILLLLSICIRLKKFKCIHIPFDKKENLVEEIFQEYKNRCKDEIFDKNVKCLQIGLLELEFMLGISNFTKDVIIGVHKIIGISKFVKLMEDAKNQKIIEEKNEINLEFEACWLELIRMDSLISISFGTKPGIIDFVNEDIERFKNDKRRYKMASIYINTIKILQKYNNLDNNDEQNLKKLNFNEINNQINILLNVQDLFFLIDVITLYYIQLQILFNENDFNGYTNCLQKCLILIWKVSLNDDSHITRIRWIIELILKNLFNFLMRNFNNNNNNNNNNLNTINENLLLSLSIIICLNNLFSLNNHYNETEDISIKLEKFYPNLNFEYCFELLTNYEKKNPEYFNECRTKTL